MSNKPLPQAIHPTGHGRQIARVTPEDTRAEGNEAFLEGARKIVKRNREMFDRLAEL